MIAPGNTRPMKYSQPRALENWPSRFLSTASSASGPSTSTIVIRPIRLCQIGPYLRSAERTAPSVSRYISIARVSMGKPVTKGIGLYVVVIVQPRDQQLVRAVSMTRAAGARRA
jgi:hypothetical protein